MLHFIAAMAVVALAVAGALRFGPGRSDERESHPRDRIDWSAYLSAPPNPCLGGHTPFYLVAGVSPGSGVICAVCTTELSRPEWMDCARCHWFPVHGELHLVPCVTHAGEREAA